MADIVNMKVVGIGGAGCNIVSRMHERPNPGVTYCCINTDHSALQSNHADELLPIGMKQTRGQGAGSNPEVGRMAAEEDRNSIARMFDGVDAVYLTAGMGGGTGTGAISVAAELAKSAGALTIGVVTTPFKWEGSRKMRLAQAGIAELLGHVDTLIIIPNENIKKVSDQKITFANAFSISDAVLENAVNRITHLLNNTGYINLDFQDLTTILQSGGLAHLGVGEASGRDKVKEVVDQVLVSALTETGIAGAQRLIVNIVGSPDVELDDTTAVMERVQDAADPEANIIFGFSFDESLTDSLQVTLIATDFREGAAPAAEPTQAAAPARRAEPARDKPAVSQTEPTPQPAETDSWETVLQKFFGDA